MRYVPDLALPALAYLPGRQGTRPPHAGPRRSFRPELWREDDAYLSGVDLYAEGFVWEAHEAWEHAWRGASGAQRELFQGLIQCAAACVKIGCGEPDAAVRLAARAQEHLAPLGTLMGLAAPAFGAAVALWVASGPTSIEARPPFSLPLHRVLSTARMNARQLVDEDVEALAAICARPENMRFVGDGQPLTRERVERVIARARENYRTRPDGFGTWAVCSREDGALLGYAGFVYPEGVEELVYTLDAAYWGRGLGTELAHGVVLHALTRRRSILATVDTDNQASRRILQRLGFVHERTGVDEHGLPTEWWTLQRVA